MSSSNEQKRSHPHVPKFGEWSDKGGNVPYTTVFDKARKGKLKEGVKIMNPNDPEENPEFSTMVEKENMKGEGMVRIKLPVVNEKNSREHFSESESVAASRSLRVGCSSRFSSHHRRRSDESESSFCSEKISFECNNSSLILQQRRRQLLKERSEKKKGLESSSRRASTAFSGHHRKQSSISITDADMISIPKFGEWDENDPKSGEDFTLKFNKVKEENKNVSEMFSTVLSSEPNRRRLTHKKSFFISKMKVVAAHILAVLGGNISPSADDLKNIYSCLRLNHILSLAVGAEAGDDRIELMLSQVKGKCITELVACGREKLASVHPSGGAGAVDVAAPETGDVASSF